MADKIDVEIYDFKIGDEIRTEGLLGNELWHVRGVVDDYVVMRRWSKKRQWWVYKIEDPYFLTLMIDGGRGKLNNG